ncbi:MULTISPECIES: hypothetical protein [Halorussus]|uniref:hypothetical protein n=1 Tax=Halorussus TaxID=1070314 RepID=UPI00209E801D|nr:hypothetical protein [Halorussus vallis]USZ75197.1 hypothetical protein NGM07_17400 [Halorussus vallis]
MRRRDTLRTAAGAAAATLVPLAGCSGGASEGNASLSVSNFKYEKGDGGKLDVLVTVKNGGAKEATGTAYATVETGGHAARRSKKVTVPAGETKTTRLSFDFAFEQFEKKGTLKVDVRS